MVNSIIYEKNNLVDMKKGIGENGTELIKVLDKLLKEIEQTENIYNTPSGVLFREKLIEYINDRKEYIKDHYLFFQDITDEIIDIYDEEIRKSQEAVGE